MEYFSILNLNKEPFSNSPDPEFFFNSRQHLGCLQKLELSIRLRRGLNVVLGEVGTGKTTLCRQLIRRFSDDRGVETHLILDPQFGSPAEFLAAVAAMFSNRSVDAAAKDWQLKEQIKQYIFRRGVDEDRIVVLIIDEGQKLPGFMLEILREFLNYETNEYKLLQIVIFAQKEFEQTLAEHANFADRINLYHSLGPMFFHDTRLMIHFRLRQSSTAQTVPELFTYPALWAIYRYTGGYPRKIINLCHRCILAMIIQNRSRVGWPLVRSCFKRSAPRPARAWRWSTVTLLAVLALVVLASGWGPYSLDSLWGWKPETPKVVQVPIALRQVDPTTAQAAAEHQKVAPALTADQEQAGGQPMPPAGPAAAPGPGQMAAGPGDDPKAEPAIVTQPATAPVAAEPEPRPPQTLGKVALQRNETLWRLVEKVYGECDRLRLQALLQANTAIRNPDAVAIGHRVAVPAITAAVQPPPVAVWWVVLDEKDQLDAAVDALRTYPQDASPIRIIPFWNRAAGLKFALALRETFFDEQSARERLSHMAPRLISGGRVLSYWDADTVFYADPFGVH